VAFSPDGKLVLTGGGKAARLWEIPSCKPFGPPLPHQALVRAVAFSPDGRLLLTGSGDRDNGEVRLWDLSTAGAIVAPLRVQGAVTTVAFSPDGKTVLGGSAAGAVRLWKVPAPFSGEVGHLKLWIQVNTGLELDAGDAVVVLDAPAWRQRLQRLRERGGLTRP
jgi:WD40 repeat protein